jgi:hypothetical protein
MSATPSHKIGIFYLLGQVIILGDYSNQESIEYLKKFLEVSFSFDGDVQSIGLQLQVPNLNRLANIYLYDRPVDEIIQRHNDGEKIDPMGVFQLKLSHDGKTDVWPLF